MTEEPSGGSPSRVSVLQYLHSSHVYHVRPAKEFLEKTLFGIDEGDFERQAKRSTASVLEECVAESVEKAGGGQLLLPLSGGLDSRSILAAYLANHRRDTVLCCTRGASNDREVIVAREVCDSLGVDWVRLTPTEPDLASFSSSAASIHSATGSYIGIGSWMMRVPMVDLAARYDAMVLTGWGQRTLAEQPLAKDFSEDYFWEVTQLFQKHSLGPPGADHGIPEALFDVALWARNRIPSDCKITLFELLGLAFPSNLRAQGNVQAMFTRSAPVFATPSWMAHWFGRRSNERLFKKKWAEELGRHYPRVFPKNTLAKWSSADSSVQKAQRRLRKLTFTSARNNSPHNPGINESIQNVEDTVRDLGIQLETRSAAETTKGLLKVLSLAGHLQAGTLHTAEK